MILINEYWNYMYYDYYYVLTLFSKQRIKVPVFTSESIIKGIQS